MFLFNRFIPVWMVQLVVGLGVLVGIFSFGWFSGADHVQKKWDKEHSQMAAAVAAQAQYQAEATVVEVVKYVDRVKVVQGKTRTIIKEVPKYVTVQADADCVVPAGFVRMHDYAAAGRVPEGPRDSDAAPAGIALSAVAETVAENYGACHENAEQVIAWQQWYKAMSRME